MEKGKKKKKKESNTRKGQGVEETRESQGYLTFVEELVSRF
jgi:hypothetical protein